MSSTAKRLRLDQRYCLHCSQIVSYKTFKAHKRLYYNNDTSQWISTIANCSQDQETSIHDRYPSLSDCERSSSPNSSEEDIEVLGPESPPLSDPGLSDSCDSIHESTGEPEVWSDCETEESENDESPPASPGASDIVTSHEQSFRPLVKWIVGLFLLLQVTFHLSGRVLDIIFHFMKALLKTLGRLHPPSAPLGDLLPLTLYSAQNMYCNQKANKKQFLKLPVCKRCGTVWKISDCVEGLGSHQKAKQCSYIPPLSRRSQRLECGAPLLKTIELATGKKIFYPLMTYCYIDLRTSLQHLLLDDEFVSKCCMWKSRQVSENVISDVYDGRVWKKFMENIGPNENFFMFMINIDWFQPYKHLTYSIGAIYLTVFNLPRCMRYVLQYVCLIGIIPGPQEPELTVNSFINPLVKDLLLLWEGVEFEVSCGSHSKTTEVRGAIICCSCDLPAGRKLCGFLGHSARLGCSKCMKSFPSLGTPGSLDHSGFDRDNWVPRTNAQHRENTMKLRHCKSKSALRQRESELGCRYSSLLKLPYFDAPTMLVIDPMHNLYLGIAKHFMKKVFIERLILSADDLKIIQRRVDSMTVPPDIGRIPQKIESSFYSFTADQYKNWVVHYSLICMHDLLIPEHFECWRHFVLACRILSKTSLNMDDITLADALLLHFCRRCENLFGKDIVTPNMHMCCHLRQCILDYGPLNQFWLFAFERFNGILGQLPNNNRSIEVQMMNRFLSDSEVLHTPLPNEFNDDFGSIIQSFQRNPVGTLGSDIISSSDSDSTKIEFPHSYSRSVLDSSERDSLMEFFSDLYACANCDINWTYKKYCSITVNGKIYGSYKSRSKSSSIILANLDEEQRPARIDYFANVSILVDGLVKTHSLVRLSWYKQHEEKNFIGKPVAVWEHDLFDAHSFIQVQDIKARTISLVERLNDVYGHVLFVSPYDNL